MTESNSSPGVFVAGTGSYVPEKVLTNDELATLVDTSDEWIVTRTGIKERRIAREDEFTSHMASEASKRALEQAGMKAEDIDLIIVGTITPDTPTPATAAAGAAGSSCRRSPSACGSTARTSSWSARWSAPASTAA